jgi:hypothetical protein
MSIQVMACVEHGFPWRRDYAKWGKAMTGGNSAVYLRDGTRASILCTCMKVPRQRMEEAATITAPWSIDE